jgi:hypothetical protein
MKSLLLNLEETPKSRIVEMVQLIFAPTPLLTVSRHHVQTTSSFSHAEVSNRSVVSDQNRNRIALSKTNHLGMS